jgi:hypothetical protein
MTDRARLEITFDQRYVAGEGCFLITSIDPVVTYPKGPSAIPPSPYDLRSSLVVQRAGSAVEKFVRIATPAELTTFAALPAVVNLFKSATYSAATPMVGDLIHMGGGSLMLVPSIWKNLHSYTGSYTYKVLDVTTYAPYVLIDSSTPFYPFPDYGRDISIYVYRADGVTVVVPPTAPAADGEAERIYPGSASEYLAATHYDFLSTNIDEALDFAIARRSEAQSVVNALNVDGYTGVFEELFE